MMLVGGKFACVSFLSIFFCYFCAFFSDLSYNSAKPVISTPNIDFLAKKGIVLKHLYTHSLCTPSRASFLTGRYHINTGLTYVLSPGTPAGLPDNIPTLPAILKDHAGYDTAMVGKWHLGHAKMSMTPVGRGFNSFTGCYMWDVDSYTKQMYEVPWRPPMMIDWVSQYVNGSYLHYAEPLHATEAITKEALNVMSSHSKQQQHQLDEANKQPLFLYVAFTAAHSPLQPLSRHLSVCSHIPHIWRREYCGMVVGIDEAVKNITDHIKRSIGENTIVVFTSDNGGSTWFGGMNEPLRGAKITPFEGKRLFSLVISSISLNRFLLF
jgi:arylsulfatase I/J